MYRKLVFGLSGLFALALLGIVGIVAWQDYQRHDDFAAGRSIGSALNRLRSTPELAAEPQPSDGLPAGEPTASAAYTSVSSPGIASGPSASSPPDSVELLRRQQFMLDLINTDRAANNAAALAIGANAAAQQHAEDMMRRNYRSHWGMDGLTPYMRYTRGGGFNRELENISGPERLIDESGETAETAETELSGLSPDQLLTAVQERFMTSPEHRANILDEWHRSVNLGIACNDFNCWVVQQFEGGHLEFSDRPHISGSVLSFAGTLRDGLEFDSVALWFHQPLQPLTLGRLDATYSYGSGQYPATFLRRPLAEGHYYPDSVFNYGWKSGIDPYTLDDGLARITTPPLRVDVTHTWAVPWTTAAVWDISGSDFRVAADLAPILKASGPGVYTVHIWARAEGAPVVLTNYSIFVE